MDFSVDFYKDEVRNGFYIPTAIKQAWAANLCVLSEIDRICEKYGITYYADWGSILGAVRHGGYVPWDDDLDICMKREDYNRFRQVADKELPDEYAIHDFRSKKDHWLFLARVVNSNQISFDEEHLKRYHNFPYISVVDIFIKDYLYRDEEKEAERCDEIKKLIAVADGIVEGRFSKDTVFRELASIEKKYNVSINRGSSPRETAILLYDIAEKQMSRVKEQDADNIGQMFPFVLKGERGLPKEYYDEIVRLPFENTTIPVPARYDEMLRNRYGNYLEMHKVWGGHNYPYFEGQRENLKAVADFSLPEFSFDPDMLKPCDRESGRADSLSGISEGLIEQLSSLNGGVIELLESGSYGEVLEIIPDIQQFVVDYGTLVENVKGEDNEGTRLVVESIQTYCDMLYEVYLLINENETISEKDTVGLKVGLNDAIEVFKNRVVDNIINKKEVLFLTLGGKEWKAFDSIYREYKKCGGYEVNIIPMPVFFKDVYGRVSVSGDDIDKAVHLDEYPDYLAPGSWKDYNIQIHRPDVVYIQNPYDSENPCITVPPQFYAVNIRQYTDKLIYIPPFKTDEFGVDDYTDMYNLKHYVTAPGVIYADEVIVQSDNIRMRYVERLTGFAGDDMKSFWMDRVRTSTESTEAIVRGLSGKSVDTKLAGNKKKILYCIGLNEISEHRSIIIDSIRKRIDIFEAEKDNIDIDISLFPPSVDVWRKTDEKVTDDIIKLIEACVIKGWSFVPMDGHFDHIDDYDAYYGSASPLVPMFVHDKKPVMIARYDIYV